MSKRGSLTLLSAKHGIQGDPLHQTHKEQGKAREAKARKVVFVAHELAEPRVDYPDFESNVLGVSEGRNYVVEDKKLVETPREDWQRKLMKSESEFSWYHQRQIRKGAVGYYERKIRDRRKLGPTDKSVRRHTDIERETIDLRPDHSRAVQYLLAAGKKEELDRALEEIRREKIRLFEKIYERRVLFVGEHTDSGQYHNDLWHCGISEEVVWDNGADVDKEQATGKKQKQQDEGEKKRVRSRNPFRAFGVGVGLASLDRHRRALVDQGIKDIEVRMLMGLTLEVIERNTQRAEEQNGVFPRDLLYLRELDRFVDRKLWTISMDLCEKASREYCEWIQGGYRTGQLGIKEAPARETKQVRALKLRVVELQAEVSALKKILDEVKEFFQRIRPAFATIRGLGKEIYGRFLNLAKLVGLEIEPGPADDFKSGPLDEKKPPLKKVMEVSQAARGPEPAEQNTRTCPSQGEIGAGRRI